jgi:hypothetical protein
MEGGRAAEFVDHGDTDAYRKLSARIENPKKPMDGSRMQGAAANSRGLGLSGD